LNSEVSSPDWDKFVPDCAENAIDEVLGGECFSLWQSIEYVELINVPNSGQYHFVAVDAQSPTRPW
jgi:hypothetical protein